MKDNLENPFCQLRLYIAGQSGRCLSAIRNLAKMHEEHGHDGCRIKLIDLLDHPHLARADNILVVPTLMKEGSKGLKRIVGDLSNTEKVLEWLHSG